jgi:folate-binding protein YgfZ
MPINPLQQIHEQAEAAFFPYGPDLRIVESYGEIESEYAAIRKGTALMDSPHRGVVILTGKDRLAFLHNKLTNDTKSLQPGTGCYAYLLNLKGRIVMDLNILQGEEATLIELDHRLAASFVEMMDKYIFTEDVRVLNGSDQLGRLTLIGPRSAALLQKIISGATESSGVVETLDAPFRHTKYTIGRTTITVFRNDLCGEPQYELIVPRDQLVTMWDILHEIGGNSHEEPDHESPFRLRAIGWSAFNTARVEAGTPLYGIDISENYLPMETGHWYLRAVAVSKGCYLGQEIVARMHAHQAVARLLVGLRISGELLPMAGTDILDEKGTQVGMVMSSCLSPMLGNVPVAMGYVKKAFSTAGKEVQVLAEGSRAKAVVTELPLWKRGEALPKV